MTRHATAWEPAPSCLVLGPDDVHLWRASLRVAPARLESLFSVLAPDERDRAAHRRTPEPQGQAVASRALVRLVLARYTGMAPEALRFDVGEHGKPELRQRAGGAPDRGSRVAAPAFNLSHCDSLALVGVAGAGAIGVDVERIRPEFNWQRLAGRYFAASELDWLQRQPAKHASEAFFRLWTCKEAVVKALGLGLSLPFSHFVVGPGPGDALQLSALGTGAGEVGGWQLIELLPGRAFVGAVALRRSDPAAPAGPLRCWEWEWGR